MPRSMRALVICAVALAACPAPDPYVEPPAQLFDFSIFPTIAGNSKLLADVGDARLEFDPTAKDAITAVGLCVDAATYCYTSGRNTLSWCLANTRTCTSDTPWNEKPCCPAACKTAFEAQVSGGASPSDALVQVFFVDQSCFPGLQATLAGGTP